MVMAGTNDNNLFWESQPDSGYSVDNLPPSVPGGAAISPLAQGPIALSWYHNRTDPDVAHYSVYRSTSPGFLVAPSTRYQITTDTLFVDSGTSLGERYYYRVTTVDIHGNESQPTAEFSEIALAVNLLSFTASAREGREVVLEWSTATETNNAGFQVEKKREGETQWVSLGFLAGHGTSSVRCEYRFVDVHPFIGRSYYRLIQVNANGLSLMIREEEVNIDPPSAFKLYQNYPNPFNPTTAIEYTIAKEAEVSLTVFDNLGRTVRMLMHRTESPGLYRVVFDGSDLPSGVYFYQLHAGTFTEKKKLLLLK